MEFKRTSILDNYPNSDDENNKEKEIMRKEIFKVGDRVFHIDFGWGEVVEISHLRSYPLYVEFNKYQVCFTSDGREVDTAECVAKLSFTEYTLQGFSQERPIKLPKKGEDVLVYDGCKGEWMLRQFVKYDEGSSNPFHCSDRNSFCVKSWSELKRIKILD